MNANTGATGLPTGRAARRAKVGLGPDAGAAGFRLKAARRLENRPALLAGGTPPHRHGQVEWKGRGCANRHRKPRMDEPRRSATAPTRHLQVSKVTAYFSRIGVFLPDFWPAPARGRAPDRTGPSATQNRRRARPASCQCAFTSLQLQHGQRVCKPDRRQTGRVFNDGKAIPCLNACCLARPPPCS